MRPAPITRPRCSPGHAVKRRIRAASPWRRMSSPRAPIPCSGTAAMSPLPHRRRTSRNCSPHFPNEMKTPLSSQVAIIGAGPYGLAAAAHLRAAKVECTIFGEAMEFWDKQMPEGMMVRSVREASHIADPQRARTLDHYLVAENIDAPHPLSRKEFVRYGKWFQRHVAPDLDPRRV